MSFVNYIEFALFLDQPRSSSSIRLEMAAIQNHIVALEIGKKIPHAFPLV